MSAKGLIPPKTNVGTAKRGKSPDIRKKVTPVMPKQKATGIPIVTVKAKQEMRIKNTAPETFK